MTVRSRSANRSQTSTNPWSKNWPSSIATTSAMKATSPESVALSKDLKQRGFKFVGPTVCHAHMQATGMVNDHLVACHCHDSCAGKTRVPRLKVK